MAQNYPKRKRAQVSYHESSFDESGVEDEDDTSDEGLTMTHEGSVGTTEHFISCLLYSSNRIPEETGPILLIGFPKKPFDAHVSLPLLASFFDKTSSRQLLYSGFSWRPWVNRLRISLWFSELSLCCNSRRGKGATSVLMSYMESEESLPLNTNYLVFQMKNQALSKKWTLRLKDLRSFKE